MSVTTVCESYISEIEATYSHTMFTEYVPSTANTDSETVTPINLGKDVLEEYCDEINLAKTSVNSAFSHMFDSDDMEHENWIMLNSYPEMFRDIQRLNESTYEFYDDLTYTYLGYQYYTCLKVSSCGQFISDVMNANIVTLLGIIEKWEQTYDESPLQTYTYQKQSSGGTLSSVTVTKQEQFWNQNVSAFSAEVNSLKSSWTSLKTDFANLASNISSYLELGKSAATAMSLSGTFLDTERKSITNRYSNVDGLYSDMNGKQHFGDYSSTVEKYCSLYYSSKDYANEHVYDFTNWTYNNDTMDVYDSLYTYSLQDNLESAQKLALYKVYTARVLEDMNFYTQASNLNSVAEDIMRRWSIY